MDSTGVAGGAHPAQCGTGGDRQGAHIAFAGCSAARVRSVGSDGSAHAVEAAEVRIADLVLSVAADKSDVVAIAPQFSIGIVLIEVGGAACDRIHSGAGGDVAVDVMVAIPAVVIGLLGELTAGYGRDQAGGSAARAAIGIGGRQVLGSDITGLAIGRDLGPGAGGGQHLDLCAIGQLGNSAVGGGGTRAHIQTVAGIGSLDILHNALCLRGGRGGAGGSRDGRGGNAAFLTAILHPVLQVFPVVGSTGTKGIAQIGVVVFVNLHAELRAALAALTDAVGHEMCIGSLVIIAKRRLEVGICGQVVLGIEQVGGSTAFLLAVRVVVSPERGSGGTKGFDNVSVVGRVVGSIKENVVNGAAAHSQAGGDHAAQEAKNQSKRGHAAEGLGEGFFHVHTSFLKSSNLLVQELPSDHIVLDTERCSDCVKGLFFPGRARFFPEGC